MKTYLEFEKDVKFLEEELEKLKDPFSKDGISEVNTRKISQLQSEIDEKLNLTLHTAQERPIRAALSNTFGFGGHNASVIFKSFTE